MRKRKKEAKVTLEDVRPAHPNEYPARHLKEILDERRDMLDDIEERNHPTGMPDWGGTKTNT